MLALLSRLTGKRDAYSKIEQGLNLETQTIISLSLIRDDQGISLGAEVNWLSLTLYFLGGLAIALSVINLWHTERWWVRIWDFPRFQIAAVSLGVFVASLVMQPVGFEWLFLSGVAAVVVWQMSWVWRYLPGAPREVPQARSASLDKGDVSLLTTNVLQSNRDADGLLQIIFDADPDVILAVETDEWWCSALKTALGSHYPHGVQYPLSNGYGLSLFSRLALIDQEVRFVLDEAIPSIRSGLQLRNGKTIELYCMHPRPPSFNQDTTERDLELVLVAKEIKARNRPAVLIGDLNDVAWSPTTAQFAQAGSLRDPRRGRGFFNTYPSRWPGLRYPLDYVFTTAHFAIVGMRVLPKFGSDHLPLIVAIRLSERDDGAVTRPRNGAGAFPR